MPAIGDISINDAETTPVAHVFSPVTTDGQRAVLANRAASIPAAFENLQLEVVTPQSATGAYRVLGSLKLPKTGTVDGQVQVVRFDSLKFELNLSQSSTAQDRKNSAKILSNLMNHPTFIAMVEKLEPLY